MFTGIVEEAGVVERIKPTAKSIELTVRAEKCGRGLKIGDSLAVNGCCLTIVALEKEDFSADLSSETIQKTSFGAKSGALKKGSPVNLEQPLTAGKELGGHFVLGHVDGTGRVTHLDRETPESDNWWFGVEVPEDFARYIVPKGSITIDGISLTVARWNKSARIAEVAVIPYSYEHTNIRSRKTGDAVNLEGDVLGKYVERYLEARNETHSAPIATLSLEKLITQGF